VIQGTNSSDIAASSAVWLDYEFPCKVCGGRLAASLPRFLYKFFRVSLGVRPAWRCFPASMRNISVSLPHGLVDVVCGNDGVVVVAMFLVLHSLVSVALPLVGSGVPGLSTVPVARASCG
jgi:hypothetical protein